jgi:hypothetical protein
LNIGARGFAGNPLASAVGQRGATVKTHCEFHAHPGQSLAHALHEPNVEFGCFGLHEPRFDGDAGTQKRVGALAANARIRVLDSEYDARDTRLDQRVDAGRRAAMMAAGLQSYVRSCARDGLFG